MSHVHVLLPSSHCCCPSQPSISHQENDVRSSTRRIIKAHRAASRINLIICHATELHIQLQIYISTNKRILPPSHADGLQVQPMLSGITHADFSKIAICFTDNPAPSLKIMLHVSIPGTGGPPSQPTTGPDNMEAQGPVRRTRRANQRVMGGPWVNAARAYQEAAGGETEASKIDQNGGGGYLEP